MHDSCRNMNIYYKHTHTHIHFCVSVPWLLFNVKWSTNHGMKDDPVQYFFLADFLPCIRMSQRLPAGNWVFQGRRLNSSIWLCWGKEYRWFSSSLFLGQGCKRGTKSSQGGSCLSQWSKYDEAQRKCSWIYRLVNYCSRQIKAWLLRFPKLLEELWLASLSFHSAAFALGLIDESENE